MTRDFEKEFEEFILNQEYEKVINDFFSLIRRTFASGWLAGGGEMFKGSGRAGDE